MLWRVPSSLLLCAAASSYMYVYAAVLQLGWDCFSCVPAPSYLYHTPAHMPSPFLVGGCSLILQHCGMCGSFFSGYCWDCRKNYITLTTTTVPHTTTFTPTHLPPPYPTQWWLGWFGVLPAHGNFFYTYASRFLRHMPATTPPPHPATSPLLRSDFCQFTRHTQHSSQYVYFFLKQVVGWFCYVSLSSFLSSCCRFGWCGGKVFCL